jgi:hypothetical protein
MTWTFFFGAFRGAGLVDVETSWSYVTPHHQMLALKVDMRH